MSALAQQADQLRALHFTGTPLILANVWDAGSARAVADGGATVIATSSAAVAVSLGLADHEQMPAEVAFAAVRRVCEAVTLPVTADMEAGYGLPAIEFVERLLEAGAVGCNLEDSDHHGSELLLDADRQAEFIAEVHQAGLAAGVDLVVNARVDAVICSVGSPAEQIDESLRRGHKYLAAGATCVYPIGVVDPGVIRRLVDEMGGPINVWALADADQLAALGELGVARASLATGLHRAAMAFVTGVAQTLYSGGGTLSP